MVLDSPYLIPISVGWRGSSNLIDSLSSAYFLCPDDVMVWIDEEATIGSSFNYKHVNSRIRVMRGGKEGIILLTRVLASPDIEQTILGKNEFRHAEGLLDLAIVLIKGSATALKSLPSIRCP